jgi:hypothetical protein
MGADTAGANWGDGAAAGGGALDNLAPMDAGSGPAGDPMGDAMGKGIIDADGNGVADMPGGEFDGAMAAMDGAAAANMAEGMDAANAGAEAAGAEADVPADSPDDAV